MTRSEVVEGLKVIAAAIEWELPIDYQYTIDEAVRYINQAMPDFDCALRDQEEDDGINN